VAKVANIELRAAGGWPVFLPTLLRTGVDAAGDAEMRGAVFRCLGYALEDLVRS